VKSECPRTAQIDDFDTHGQVVKVSGVDVMTPDAPVAFSEQISP
jgi:hypothetical protein